ncbi:hypothetical protein Pfo_016529, partial [Paulownia fortunei]
MSKITEERTQKHIEINKQEIDRLRNLLLTFEKPSGISSFARSGDFPVFIGLNVSDETFANSWIMDSGATDHMTHSSQKFSTYNPCPSNRKITTADGSLTTVAGIGDVPISPTLILKNVFHVPKLSTSLVSIQKLTQNLCCNVIFH